MFIINITYKVDLKEVDKYLEAHIDFLNEQYELGNFIASGRKIPRTGGIILSNIEDENQIISVIAKDPFKKNNLADYKITEFIPSKTSKELDFLIK